MLRAGAEEQIYGAAEEEPPVPLPSRPPPDVEQGKEDLLRRVHLDPKPSAPQMFIDLRIQSFKRFLRAAVVALLSRSCPGMGTLPCHGAAAAQLGHEDQGRYRRCSPALLSLIQSN